MEAIKLNTFYGDLFVSPFYVCESDFFGASVYDEADNYLGDIPVNSSDMDVIIQSIEDGIDDGTLCMPSVGDEEKSAVIVVAKFTEEEGMTVNTATHDSVNECIEVKKNLINTFIDDCIARGLHYEIYDSEFECNAKSDAERMNIQITEIKL